MNGVLVGFPSVDFCRQGWTLCVYMSFEGRGRRVGGGRELTLPKNLENGRPRSRANDQIIRDEVATKPTVAQKPSTIMMHVMAELPAKERVAW